MRRSIAGAITLALSLSVVSTTAANAAPTTCGTLCTQTVYDNADLGAWFLDGVDGLLLADDYGFRVVNIYTQKTTFRYETTMGARIEAISPSANSNWVGIALSSGEVYRYDTEDWSQTRIGAGSLMTDVDRVAVSSDGEEVYVARNANKGSVASTVQRFHNGVLASGETFTPDGDDYGVYELILDDYDTNLYIGRNGHSPTFSKFDAMDVSAGPVAGDDSVDAWSGTSIEIASNGTVYGGNSGGALSYDPGEAIPHVLKMNASTLAVSASLDSSENWTSWEIALSEDDETLYAASMYVGATAGDDSEANKIEVIDASTLDVEQTLVFPDLSYASVASIDVDYAGNYLVAAMDGDAYIVSLDSSPATIASEYFNTGEPGSTQLIDWQYAYINPRAKFKWFEVKYVPVGKRKAVVKRVKRATQTEIGQVKPGTDIRVRAVYTSKRYNTAWATSEPAAP